MSGQEKPTVFGAKALQQIREVVRRVLGEYINGPLLRTKPNIQQRNVQGKLDGPLAVATAFDDSPATAVMSVWRKNADGDMEDSTDNITIVNRFEHISVDTGAIVKAEWIDGEWQLYAADCGA